jgi:hypothetical protein
MKTAHALIVKNLLIFSFLFISVYANSQEWYPIGAKWHYGFAEYGCVNPNSDKFYSHTYEITKDTIILGQHCKELSGYDIFGNGLNQNANKIYLLDSFDKVYYYPPALFENTKNDWSLLYDFTKNVGDTIWYENMKRLNPQTGDTSIYYNVVSSKGTRIINGDTLKRYSANSLVQLDYFEYYTTWFWTNLGLNVTKVLGGGIPFFGAHWAGGCLLPQGLRCYEDSILGFFKSPSFNLACDTAYSVLSVSINDKLENNFKVFPNPTNDILNIHLNYISSNTTFNLYDLQGMHISTQKLNDNQNAISLKKVPQGLYIYEISNSKEVVRGEVVRE